MRSRARAGLAAALLAASPAALCCTVSTGTLAFGSINPLLDGERNSTTTITVACPSATSYTIALGTGSGTYGQRTLVSGSNLLNYNLHADSQRTQIWGDGSGMTVTVPGTADGTGTHHTVYGSVPAQSRAVPGSYSDTVLVTVSY